MNEIVKPFDADTAFELQQKLGQRLQDSKTRPTAQEVEEQMDQFCSDLIQLLGSWVQLGKRAAFGEGCVLYWVEKYWEQLTPLHQQYDSFNEFATRETGEEYSTWRAKISAYRTYILNESNDPVIAEKGPEVFLDVPFGKLARATASVHRGEMDENKWDALLDPEVHDRQFHHVIRSENGGVSVDASSGEGLNLQDDEFAQNGSGPEITVDMNSGELTYWSGGNVGVRIGSLDVQNKQETVRGAIDEIIDSAGIRRR